MKKFQTELNSKDAKELLVKEAKERQERCMKRIKEILDEENCNLDWFEHKVNGQVVQTGIQATVR